MLLKNRFLDERKLEIYEDVIPIKEIHEMYNPYHEMDISQFCDHMIALYNSRKQ